MQVDYTTIKQFIIDRSLTFQYVEFSNSYKLKAIDGPFELECDLDKSPSDSTDLDDFETNYKAGANTSFTDSSGHLITKGTPFADKSNIFFRGTGVQQNISANSTEDIIYTVPYAKCKINGIEIINGNNGDTCNFKVKDSTTGTYTTVANYLLNQFGYDWNVNSNGTYKTLPYDADLFINMQIIVEYTNNDGSDRDVYINFDIHEDKS